MDQDKTFELQCSGGFCNVNRPQWSVSGLRAGDGENTGTLSVEVFIADDRPLDSAPTRDLRQVRRLLVLPRWALSLAHRMLMGCNTCRPVTLPAAGGLATTLVAHYRHRYPILSTATRPRLQLRRRRLRRNRPRTRRNRPHHGDAHRNADADADGDPDANAYAHADASARVLPSAGLVSHPGYAVPGRRACLPGRWGPTRRLRWT